MTPRVDEYVSSGPDDVLVVQPEDVVLVVYPEIDVVEVTTPGPQGGKGTQGIPGPLSMTFGREGEVVVGVGQTRWYNDFGVPLRIASTRATLGTPPVGSPMTADVNIDGGSIFTNQANRPSIADGGYTDQGGVPDVVDVPAGSYLTADLDAIGSVFAGSNLSIQVVFENV